MSSCGGGQERKLLTWQPRCREGHGTEWVGARWQSVGAGAHHNRAASCVLVSIVTWTQPRVSWEERTSAEGLPLSGPVCGRFLGY